MPWSRSTQRRFHPSRRRCPAGHPRCAASRSVSATTSPSTTSISTSARQLLRAARPVGLRQDDHAADDRRLRGADGGQVELGGVDVTDVPPHKRDVNTVFQSYALFPHGRSRRNVAFGLERKKVAKDEVKRRVAEALELVSSAARERRKPAQMSGGQQQRVALARALVNRPRALLLDEPLGALDLRLRKQLQLELSHIQREVGITFVHVTHDQEEAMTMADTIAVMRDGRIDQLGRPTELYDTPRTEFVANFLGSSNLIDARRTGATRRSPSSRPTARRACTCRRRAPKQPGGGRCGSACGRRRSRSSRPTTARPRQRSQRAARPRDRRELPRRLDAVRRPHDGGADIQVFAQNAGAGWSRSGPAAGSPRSGTPTTHSSSARRTSHAE